MRKTMRKNARSQWVSRQGTEPVQCYSLKDHQQTVSLFCLTKDKTLQNIQILLARDIFTLKIVLKRTSQTLMYPSVPPVIRRFMSGLNLTTFWRGSCGLRSDSNSAKLVTVTWAVSFLVSDMSPVVGMWSRFPLSTCPGLCLVLRGSRA